MSKLGINLWDNYNHAVHNCYTSLDDVYNSYSYAKAQAFRYCEDLRDKFHGKTLFVTSANTFQFACAFECEAVNKETGEVIDGLVYITANNDRFVTDDCKVYPLYKFDVVEV